MTHVAELATLERLLDDPSPVVRLAVLSKIKAAGLPGVLWLESLTKDESLAAHARTLLADLRTPEAGPEAYCAARTPSDCGWRWAAPAAKPSRARRKYQVIEIPGLDARQDC